jgi:hypothetical protein
MKSSRHSGNSVHCPRSASSTKRLINSPIESRENHNSSTAFSHSQGHQRTCRPRNPTSVLPQEADIARWTSHVRNVPNPEVISHQEYLSTPLPAWVVTLQNSPSKVAAEQPLRHFSSAEAVVGPRVLSSVDDVGSVLRRQQLTPDMQPNVTSPSRCRSASSFCRRLLRSGRRAGG